MDLGAYREDAEAFVTELGREHYRHFAGLKPSLEIEPVYEAHAHLFTQRALDEVRSAGSPALLEFCVEGLIGRAITSETAALADREASLEIQLDGRSVPFRQSAIEQANEPEAERRAALERARLALTERELDPLLQAIHHRTRELADELGWADVSSMCADLSGIDLRGLEREMQGLLEATAEEYDRFALPRVVAELGVDEVQRSDLPAFFRARHLDKHFPESKLLASLTGTLEGLGLDAGERVRLDTERRPTKSPRAFCVPVVVPDEVYLVISPHGGRDDYEALLHEAGHAHHYASVDGGLDFERRHLGDNSVTESYAFLLQRLATEPEWLQRHLDVEGAPEVAEHARAAKLVFLRRYAAKLGYEIELYESEADPAAHRRAYSRRLSDALRIDWPEETWLADVDPFFYAARYLRAWSLEASLARDLATRLGPAWFAERGAGDELALLWSEGQPARAEELMGPPDPSALIAELARSG